MAQHSGRQPGGKVLENPTLPREALVKKLTNLRELNSSVFSSNDPYYFEVWALGRAAFQAGASGILARSAAVAGVNVVVFPGNLGKGESLAVVGGEKLRRLAPKD